MKLGVELKAPWEVLGIPMPSFKFNLETEPFRPAEKKTLKNITNENERARQVLRQAHRDGVRGLPDSTDTEPNGVQRDLEQNCHDAATKIESVVNANIEAFSADFRRLDELTIDSKRVVQQYKTQLDAFLSSEKARAIEVIRGYLDSNRRLREFKADRGLTREAVLASEGRSEWLIVIGVALLEFFVSLGLFMVALPGGAREAFPVLLPITIANIVMGIAAGFYGVRSLHRAGNAWKSFGAMTIFGSLALAFYLNVQIARVRDIVSTEAGTSIFAALQDLKPTPQNGDSLPPIRQLDGLPFGLTGIESLTFLVLGMITWGFALWKGMKAFDDVVPGYSEATKERDKARSERDAFYHQLRTAIHMANSSYLSSFAAVRHGTMVGVHALERQFVEQKQALIDAKARYAVLKNYTINNIKAYREVNRHSRRKRRFFFLNPIQPEVPGYFASAVEISREVSRDYSSIEVQLKDMRERARTTLSSLDKAIADLSEEMGKTVDLLAAFERKAEAEAEAEAASAVSAVGVKLA